MEVVHKGFVDKGTEARSHGGTKGARPVDARAVEDGNSGAVNGEAGNSLHNGSGQANGETRNPNDENGEPGEATAEGGIWLIGGSGDVEDKGMGSGDVSNKMMG